jgi:16S rRNA (adenine1518-N6/adenine1519-N6)-dimethyltransferase
MPDNRRFIHKSSLGQNFLVDKNILYKIIEYADISPQDVILEVGSGMGVLTRELAVSGCRRVLSVEIDNRLKEHLIPLEREFSNLSIMWTDAVKLDYSSLSAPLPNKMIANIPYNITTPLLWKILSSSICERLDYFLLMVQKEASDRICADPGTKERYPLGITIDAIGRAKPLHRIPPQAFRPIPRVDSVLLEIRIDKQPSEEYLPSDPRWNRMLRTAFSQRRKKLVNNLGNIIKDISKQDIMQMMEDIEIDPASRAEELTTSNWILFYKALRDHIEI